MTDEQNFNDDELAEIMNEIENLEEDMDIVTEEPDEFTVVGDVDAIVDEVHEAVPVLEEVVKMEAEQVIPSTNVVDIAPSPAPTHNSSAGTSSMNFNIEGQMNIEMGFTIGGQFVAISVNEDGFEIAMESGAKFTIPLEGTSSSKKVA
jgi:hypothetical protein